METNASDKRRDMDVSLKNDWKIDRGTKGVPQPIKGQIVREQVHNRFDCLRAFELAALV